MASQNMYAIGLSSLAIAALLVVVRHYANKRLSLPFPPGPKPLPVLGNVLDIPSKAPWKTYNDWFKVYGMAVAAMFPFEYSYTSITQGT